MAINQKKESRYTTSELGLIRSLFENNKELVFAIRKVLLQFPLTDKDEELIQNLRNEPTEALLRKALCPTLDSNAPIFQLSDLVQSLEPDIKELSPEGAWPLIKAKDLEMKYINQQLNVLFGKEDKPEILLADLAKLDLEDDPSREAKDEVFIRVRARNFLLSFVDTHLYLLVSIAAKKEETPEETLKRLERDSTQ